MDAPGGWRKAACLRLESPGAFEQGIARHTLRQRSHCVFGCCRFDYYSLPNVYVLVLLRDTTIESGPWTFLPKSVSQQAAVKLNNWGRGVGYRFTDEQVYGAIDRKHEIQFVGPRGSVLFIESSGCMHFGRRNSVVPQFQLMLGYRGAIRTDLSEVIMTPKVYPIRPTDSRLRHMVLNKNMLPAG